MFGTVSGGCNVDITNKTTYICLSPGQPSISAELLHFCGSDVTVAIFVMRLEQCGNVSSTEVSPLQTYDDNYIILRIEYDLTD